MIAVSRKRGYSDETIIDTAEVSTTIATRTNGNRSQLQCGPMPQPRMKRKTTTRLSVRLKRLVSTTASGITSRGNCVLRTTDSWLTIELTAVVVASWKKPKSTMLNSSSM